MDRLTTPARPDLMVGAWVRLRDHERPECPYLGVLERADPDPDQPGLWHWALRTPTGTMSGGPHLPAQSLTREHHEDVARALPLPTSPAGWWAGGPPGPTHDQEGHTMPITIVSFGHLHGAPPQAHLVADLRGHFRNPDPDLDIDVLFPDPRVLDQVRSTPGIAELVASLAGAARAMAEQGGETSLAVGCAGGRHRAPTVADQVATALQEQGHTVHMVHRDLPELAESASNTAQDVDIDDPIDLDGVDFALAPLTRSGEDPDQARARLEALTEAWHSGFTAPDLSRALADEQGLTRSRSWVLTELRRLEAAGRLWQDDDGRWSPAA